MRKALLEAAEAYVGSLLNDSDSPFVSELLIGDLEENEIGEGLLALLLKEFNVEQTVTKILSHCGASANET